MRTKRRKYSKITVIKGKNKQNDNHYVAQINSKKGASLGSKAFLKEQLSKLCISIVGLNLTDKDTMHVGSQIRNMVGATIEGNKSKLQDAQDQIRILLEKRLDLAQEDRKEIETQIKQLVQRILPVSDESVGTTKVGLSVTRYDKTGGPYGSIYQPLSRSCIMAGTIPGDCYPILDWRLINVPALSPLGPPRPPRPPRGSTSAIITPQLPQTYALYFLDDVFAMTVAEGVSMGLSPTSMIVTLKTRPSVTWAKSIVGWHLTLGATTAVFTSGNNRGPNSMRFTRADCTSGVHTIILEKAKLFGVMTSMYHFDANFFWPILGGKIVTIDWVGDNARPVAPYPVRCRPLQPCKGCGQAGSGGM
jgi:hypothetical protein